MGIGDFFSGLAASGGGGRKSGTGISIGTHSIKLVELKRVGKEEWKLLHFGKIQLPESTIINREIVNAISVTESIKRLVDQVHLQTTNVCVSLSGTAVITKKMSVELPSRANKKEIEDQVFWEAEQYLPYDVSELYLDFSILNKGRDGLTEVILVAAKQDQVESYMSVVADAGLKPDIVDLDYFALQNVFEMNYPDKVGSTVALVDLGSNSIKVVILQNGIPLFTKESVLGGKTLTSEIQKHMSLSFEDAEALKNSTNQNQIPQEVSDLMGVMSENFATEVKKAIDVYQASGTGGNVSSIYLCGGSAKIPVLPKTVEQVCEIRSQILNPFNTVTYDPEVFQSNYLSDISTQAAVPIGLAIRAGAGP